MEILIWIFTTYIVVSVFVTIGCILDGDDLPDAMAMGMLWFFTLVRAVLRSMAKIIKEG